MKPAVQRAGNDTQIVAESITGKDGKFTFSALLPPRETLFIVRKDQPSKNLIEIRIDQFGKPFQSDLNAAISSFQCSFTPAAGFGSLSIKDRPELVSKIRNAITDMLAAVQAVWHNSTGSSGEPARLQPQNSTLAKLGINPEPSADCPYPNSGWRLSLRGACGAPTVMAGMKAVKIQIEVVSNKTRCLAQGVQPFRIDVGSYFYVLPPIARHDIVEEASAANGNHATLRGAAEFSQDGQHSCPAGFERNNVTHRPELNDATFHLLFSYWQKAGLNGTCGPFSHEVKDKSTVKVLSSCTKDFDIGSILATSHYLRLFAAVPCTKLGAPNKEWAALIVGNSTIFSYFYDIYKAKRTNITFGPNASEQRNVVPSLRESINKKSGKVVARNLQAAKSLATQPVAPLAPVLPAPSRMSPNPSLFNRGTGLFPRGEDSNAACLTGWCAFVLSALDKAATDNANLLNINIKGLKINLLSFFSPSKFITATGKSICNMMVKGSDLAWWASASGPGAWLSVVDVPVFSDAMSWSDLFTSLPVSNDKYYVLGFYSSTVPGVTYPPTMPSIQVASAINICTGDFLFAFAGLQFEVEWRDPPLTLTVSLDAMGFSIPGSVQASALGFVTSFWAPSGFQTLDITGQMYVQGTISTTFGDPELDPVAIGVSATGLMMLNSDPAKNGWGKADVSFGLQVSTAPSLTLLQGAITIDLSGLASATATLMFNFLSAKNFQLAFQTTFNVALADFLATLPQIGEPISDALGMIFGGLALNGEFDVWISNVEWGLRICMGGAGMFGPLGAAWTLMTTFIPSLPSTIENCYSIGGPMTGSGLPVKMTAYYSGKSFSMYFCKRDSHCPSGYSCNSGICSTIACPSAHPNMQGLLCYDSCRDGYTNVLGVCWETCRSGFVDAGAICVQSVGASCPSGYEKDGGLCYPKCRDGYSGVSGVCWEKCRDGYSDTGAFCTSPAITRGKGCCCYSYLKCRGWKCSWKKSCCDACDDGFRDTGCTCFRSSNTYAKNSYSRSPSSAMYAKNTYTIPAYPLNIKIAGLVW